MTRGTGEYSCKPQYQYVGSSELSGGRVRLGPRETSHSERSLAAVEMFLNHRLAGSACRTHHKHGR